VSRLRHVPHRAEVTTSEVPLPSGGFHLRASCPDCGRFICFIPHSPVSHFYFGKHKSRLIRDVVAEDRAYCEWLLRQEWVRPRLRATLEESLSA